jgi:hypothetical protein
MTDTVVVVPKLDRRGRARQVVGEPEVLERK